MVPRVWFCFLFFISLFIINNFLYYLNCHKWYRTWFFLFYRFFYIIKNRTDARASYPSPTSKVIPCSDKAIPFLNPEREAQLSRWSHTWTQREGLYFQGDLRDPTCAISPSKRSGSFVMDSGLFLPWRLAPWQPWPDSEAGHLGWMGEHLAMGGACEWWLTWQGIYLKGLLPHIFILIYPWLRTEDWIVFFKNLIF